MIGTTKPTINAIRDRTHWNSSNLQLRSPVEVGLCSHQELHDAVVITATKAAKRRPKDAEEGTEEAPEAVVQEPVAPFVAAAMEAAPEPELPGSGVSRDPMAAAEALFKKTEEPEEEKDEESATAAGTLADIWPGDKPEGA